MKSIFYKDLAAPIFNSPLCGFSFGAAHHDICSHSYVYNSQRCSAPKYKYWKNGSCFTFQTKGTYNGSLREPLGTALFLPFKLRTLATQAIQICSRKQLFLPSKLKALTTSI